MGNSNAKLFTICVAANVFPVKFNYFVIIILLPLFVLPIITCELGYSNEKSDSFTLRWSPGSIRTNSYYASNNAGGTMGNESKFNVG